MATFNASTDAQRNFVARREEVLERLHVVAMELARRQADVASHEALLADVGARVRAGLVADIAALDGQLEDPLTDIQIVRTAGVITQVRTNADVTA